MAFNRVIDEGNLLIVRSMTKDYSLADLRLGYAVANRESSRCDPYLPAVDCYIRWHSRQASLRCKMKMRCRIVLKTYGQVNVILSKRLRG